MSWVAFIPKGQATSFGLRFFLRRSSIGRLQRAASTFPWWGEMKTPKRALLYLTPTHPAKASIGAGANLIRKDSFDGSMLARRFCELAQNSGRGGPSSCGLPERTDLQFNGGLKRNLQPAAKAIRPYHAVTLLSRADEMIK